MRLPVNQVLELFDGCVRSVLTYGAEVWGFADIEPIERFHRCAVKRLLKVRMNTHNVMTYGETGVFPIGIHVATRMCGYWARLITGKQSKLSFIMYRLVRSMHLDQSNDFHSPWIAKVQSTLTESGLEHLWQTQPKKIGIDNMKLKIRQHLEKAFILRWHAEKAASDTCSQYHLFKHDFKLEPYLLKAKYGQRIDLARFRCRSNFTPIANLMQYINARQHTKACPMCRFEPADEPHYLFYCPYFEVHRPRLIYPLVESVYDMNINFLMSIEDPARLKKLATFIGIVLDIFQYRVTRYPGIFPD